MRHRTFQLLGSGIALAMLLSACAEPGDGGSPMGSGSGGATGSGGSTGYYEALHFSIYTPSDSLGSTERIDNTEVSRTARAYPANCTAVIPYDYASALTSTTADVKTVVPASAGVGKT